MAKRTKRFFRPGAEGGEFILRRRKKNKDGSTESLPSIRIGGSGFVTEDPQIQKELDSHPLKGHRLGFIEVESFAPKKVIANRAGDQEKEIIPPSTGKDTSRGGAEAQGKGTTEDTSDPEADNTFDSLPADTKFPYHYGGGHYFLSDGSKFKGKKKEAQAAEEEISRGGAEAQSKKGEDEDPKVTVVEDVTNINQLKDYVIEYGDVDAATLTTPDAILAAAEALDPPAEFPNLKTGG